MAGVVVVGGGLAGMAVAARLAKQGHEVTLVERRQTLGGAIEQIAHDGFTWDAGPTHTLVPAVLRDLFRKTGRPAEREIDLHPLEPVREHWFADGSVLALPGGSRGAQLAAVDALDADRPDLYRPDLDRPDLHRTRRRRAGRGLGQQWVDHVAAYADDWEVLRRGYVEQPWDPADLPPDLAARLHSRETLHRRLRRTLTDERLRRVAAHPFVADGHDPRDVPAWAGLVAYLEQRFGLWTIAGGMAALTDALTRRLATRGVTVLTGVSALDVVVHHGRAAAVRTDTGDLDADVVVSAIDPRLLPTLAPLVTRTMPAMPPVVCHVGVHAPAEAIERLAHEVVLHTDPLLVVRRGTGAPDGAAALSVHGRGRVAEDLLVSLARQGIDLRPGLVTRVDLTPREQVERWGSSPHGVLWQGRGTVRHRLGPRTPIPGVFACGAHATPGSAGAGVPLVGLSAALVAQVVGPA